MELISDIPCFAGRQLRYRHASSALDCNMQFSVYLPPAAEHRPVPVVYWLSGLTCTDENFVTKAGAQRAAARLGLALVAPDTSPRGENVPDDPDGSWDFGLGAGFYVNATEWPWRQHYQMYDYVTTELPKLIAASLPVAPDRAAISGHSMGGHGAMTIALKNPDDYCSVSAFAPICSPMNCPWGEKAFGYYLGDDRDAWAEWDSCQLVLDADFRLPLLVDQGSADGFLVEQLKPELLLEACREADYPLNWRLQHGYDHSYFFIATFIEDHLAFHAAHLGL